MWVDYEYIDKSSARVTHIFNSIWISRYPHPRKIIFEKQYESKRCFTSLLKNLYIKPIYVTQKKTQVKSQVEWVHEVIFIMIVAKVLYNRVLDYIDPWSKTLAYTAWDIRDSSHQNINTTPAQYFFGSDMIFK